MGEAIRRGVEWLNERTGIPGAVRDFFLEEIPASAGWPQVFGSIALFLFLLQAFTGVLLALNYAGTPGDAYNSLTFLIREVPLGRLLHGLHHWGASMMVIIVVLHMTQVFLYGAYKKPREVTWIAGVCLLLLTLGFGLTGYLLPWDNRAYWGTVVTTKIAGQAPFLGNFVERMLGSEDGVGVLTFARFYALHVLVLPAVMVFLIVVHVFLVRRHGVAPAPSDARPPRKFFPEQAFRDTVAIFVCFVLVFLAALLVDVPLGRLADPTDSSFVPRPEWYFLFLFQLLKFFEGSLEPIGTVVLPTVAVLVLFLVPFLDVRRSRTLRRRIVAFSVAVFAFAGWSALTYAAIRGEPARSSAANLLSQPVVPESTTLSAEETAGIGYFREEHCESCHNLIDGEPKPGPTLAHEGPRRSAEWMIHHFQNPGQMIPGSNMPPIHLGLPELNALSAFLLRLTPENARKLVDAPPEMVEGAQVYVANLCASCHKVNGLGGESGPPLNGLAARRSPEWIEKHFEAPQKLTPGSIMPPYHFPPAQRDVLTRYLLALP
jgi:quinol-cytochrome oxidoreductase complex cytochrome b subunit